ncbi:MAG: D-alanyl-D-alanine carboxypeptidase [Ruminococcus sp.]|nr:D-alanyl-D-alanine carboxypeptidase [Ruminococcus sp.]
MKKILAASAALCCFAFVRLPSANAEDIEVSAKAAAVISADTGELVYSKNSDEKLPMASTTKIMTALICLESGGLYEPFTVDSDAIHVEGSSMGLQEGDTVTKYALACGMLLPSGNDGANAAAVEIAGSIEAFADIMNDRAEAMGLNKTFFVTPSGLEGVGHGSSARDMAVLAAEALKNETFRKICSSETLKLEYGNPPYTRWLKNTNKLLTLYSGTYGVKTGFTDEAGRCLVSACERDGKRLICVTLNAPDDWNDHMKLYESCFGKVTTVSPNIPQEMSAALAGSDRDSLRLTAGGEVEDITVLSASPESFEYTVAAPPFVYAPIREGDEAAELIISSEGRELRRIPLYAAENADYKSAADKKEKNKLDKIIAKVKDIFN